MPSSQAADTVVVETNADYSDIVSCFQPKKKASIDSENTAAPATKKQKTSGGTSVKSVKTVDPAIIAQRRDAVNKRILVLESKLIKDRALLAKYTVPCIGDSNPEKQDDTDENDSSSSNEK